MRIARTIVSIFLLAMLVVVIVGCAGTAVEVTKQVAVATKTTADGLGHAYLDYCERVRKPQCVSADAAAKATGSPQTKEDRIACLKPCDSATADRVAVDVDFLRTAQLAVFVALAQGGSEEELAQARADLAAASKRLLSLLGETGVLDVLREALDP